METSTNLIPHGIDAGNGALKIYGKDGGTRDRFPSGRQ